MKTLITRTLAVCLLAVSFAGHSSSTGKDAGKVRLRASIVVDASGKLTSIEWLNTKPSAQFVTSRLEDVVRDWSFEPGKLNGVPAITQTVLSLDISVEKTGIDTLVLNIDDARTGAVNNFQNSPPSYPGYQARDGASAYVEVALDADETGKVVSAAVTDYAGNLSTKSSRKEFENAALSAAKSWTFRPEIVGGIALPSKHTVPIMFCAGVWCAEHERKLVASGKDVVPSGTSVALDSAVKILTRTSSVKI
jgi:TonB family protein